MNHRIVLQTLGKLLAGYAVLLLIPLAVVFIDGEVTLNNILGFTVPAAFSLLAGVLLSLIKSKDKSLYSKEGLVIVGFGWIIIAAIGALPFVICTLGIPELADMTYIDYLFESISGFTTTGATILHSVNSGLHQIDFMYANGLKGLLFWRSLTHWVGGMGVLIFLVAVLPSSQNASSIHLMQAESTGATVDKFTAKMGSNAKILYIIYGALTVIMCGFLLLGMVWDPLMNGFHAIVLSLGTAGTGGFAALSSSIGEFSVYTKIVITIFMLLFGVNFNIYYLIFIGRLKEVFGNEELHFYLITLVLCILAMAISLVTMLGSVYSSFGNALLDSSFTAVSLMTSTGFAVCDFTDWPDIVKILLLLLMFIGACAGSTGGGFKCSRFILLVKSSIVQLRKKLNRRSVLAVKLNGKKISEDVISETNSYFMIYFVIFIFSLIWVGVDLSVQATGNTLTAFSSVLTCFNNIGPGMTSIVGPNGAFFFFSVPTKILLCFLMLLGRLEIYPILLLFSKKTYSRGV